jgi:lipoprotein signal peptidase
MPDHSRTLLATIALVPAADLVTKTLVAALATPQDARVPLAPLMNSAFLLGLGRAGTATMVAIMAIGLAAGALLARRVVSTRAAALGAGLALGGGLSNTIDRVLHGAVQDYLVVGTVVINLADLAVLTGLVMVSVLDVAGIAGALRPRGSRSRSHARSERRN